MLALYLKLAKMIATLYKRHRLFAGLHKVLTHLIHFSIPSLREINGLTVA